MSGGLDEWFASNKERDDVLLQLSQLERSAELQRWHGARHDRHVRCLGLWGRRGRGAGGRVVSASDQLQELIKAMQAVWVWKVRG